jgi:hypothetical protein
MSRCNVSSNELGRATGNSTLGGIDLFSSLVSPSFEGLLSFGHGSQGLISDSAFVRNTAGAAVIEAAPLASVSVSQCSFEDNSASHAIFLARNQSTVTISNSSFGYGFARHLSCSRIDHRCNIVAGSLHGAPVGGSGQVSVDNCTVDAQCPGASVYRDVPS